MSLFSDLKGTLNSFFRVRQIRLKDDAGALDIRNAADTDWAEVFAFNFNSIAYQRTDDFENGVTGTVFSSSVSGTGAAVAHITVTNANEIGVIRFSTGTTATGSAGILTGIRAIRLGSGEATFEAIIRTITLPTLTENYTFRIGFIDASLTDATDGVYFEFNASNANWMMCAATANTRTKTASTSAVGLTTCTLKIIVNAAGTSASFYYNNTLLGSVTTNIPKDVNQETGWGAGIVKSAGTTDRSIDIDWMRVRIKQTSPRFS